MEKIKKSLRARILKQQKTEITDYEIYTYLLKVIKNGDNKKILDEIIVDELRHYKIWKSITKEEVKSNKLKVLMFKISARTLGLVFTLRLLERHESVSHKFYDEAEELYPTTKGIAYEEKRHEALLSAILNAEKLSYAGSVVLGLSDALVELTGTLVGLSLAFSSSFVVGVTGLIIGVAASLSMAGSEYLSSEEDDHDTTKNSITSAIYTGISYIVTVLLLVMPFFVFTNIIYSVVAMLSMSVLIILGFTSYISVAKAVNFKKKFFTMLFISFGVALVSFCFSYFIKHYLGIEI